MGEEAAGTVRVAEVSPGRSARRHGAPGPGARDSLSAAEA